MTLTRVAPNQWELRTRHGTLLATGDLYAVVTAWARLHRDGWSDAPYGQPAAVGCRRTVEYTACHDCGCRACSRGGLCPEASSLRPGE
jgi:hypothetical protein